MLEIVSGITFALFLILTWAQRSSLTIITHMCERKPGNKATIGQGCH